MKRSKITIKEEPIKDAIAVSQQIPEFENIYKKNEYKKRIKDVKHLILVAYIKDKPVGFKIGYEMPSKQNFYSWMGGVLPKYRQLGVAEKLYQYQENWTLKVGYSRIIVKTRVKYSSMIKLLQKHGFIQMGIIPYNPNEETRMIFEKKL